MKRNKVIYIIIFLLLIYHAVFAGQAEKGPDEKAIAVIGNHLISVDEFQEVIIRYRESDDMQKVLETLTPEGKERILTEMIEQRLLALEAQERGLDQDQEIKRIIESTVNSLLIDFLIEKEIGRLDLSDDGLRKYYKSNQEAFMTEVRIKAKHIVTATRYEAEEALKEVKNGRDFSDVASELNIDSSKAKGGDLGWISRGIMVKPFEEALFSLKEGHISDIVKTSFGYHIAKAEKIDKGQLKSFEIVREDIKKRIIDQHISQLKGKIKKKYPIKINKEILKEIEEMEM